MLTKIIGTFTTKLLSAVVNLLIVVLTTRFLGASGKGETSLIIANITIIQLLNNFIGGTALVYLTPRTRTVLLLVPAYIWALVASGIGSWLLFLFGLTDQNTLFHVFFLSLIFSFFSIHQMVLMGKQKIGWHNFFSLLQIVITALVLIVFFYFLEKKTVFSFLVSIYLAYGICLLGSIFVVFNSTERFNLIGILSELKNILNYGFVAQISSIITFFNYRLSYYLLNNWQGKEAVGVYSTGVSIAEATWMLSKSIALVQYAKVANESDNAKAIRLTNSLTKLSFWVAFIIVLVLLAIPPVVYEWIFGSGFSEIHLVIMSLSVGILSISFSTTFLHYFSGKGKYGTVNLATTAALVFTVVLSWILLPKYGLVGAGIAASIAYFAQSFYLYIVYRKESGFSIKELFSLKEELEIVKTILK